MPCVPYTGSSTLFGGRLTSRFAQRRVLITSGVPHVYEPRDWEAALVVVERGQLELEWSEGARLRFEPGDTLCLVGLDLCALHCASPYPTLLLAVSLPNVQRF
jgi:hypothetical protein